MEQIIITSVTRQNIFDGLQLARQYYYGRLSEPDFLSRVFNLKEIPSRDHRFKDAYGDIFQHMVNNNDWESDWIFTDSRFNLLYCADEIFLKFLCETIHPIVRSDSQHVHELLEIYNRYLVADEFEIIQTSEISKMPVFSGRKIQLGQETSRARSAIIREYLTTDYVSINISRMNEAISTDSNLAIGTAKELIETVCKSILNQRGVKLDKDWTVSRLLKETTNVLEFLPKKIIDPRKAESSIKQILGGIGSIIQGITELRNSYGTGHGKDPDFVGLESQYAKLIVGVTSEVCILLLSINGETADLIE